MAKVQKIIPFKHYEDPVELKISKLNEYGQGIAYLDEYEVYLDGVIDGERVLCKVGDPFANGSKRRGGEVLSILERSKDRAKDKLTDEDSIYPYSSLTYEGTLKRKRQSIEDALREAKVDVSLLDTVAASDVSKACRFKSIRYFANHNGMVVNGFYRPRSHTVIAVDKCALEPQWMSFFANSLCQSFTAKGIEAYDEVKKTGLIRSLMMRDTIKGRMCVLNLASDPDESIREILISCASNYEIDAVYACVNKTCGNKVMGDTLYSLTDTKTISVELCSLKFNAGPYTFVQVNYEIADAMYEMAVNYCASSEHHRHALDLCCGCGTMTLALAKHFDKVTGVEIVPEAILQARINAKENAIDNAQFIASDLKDCISSLAKDGSIDAVICDPARAGLGEKNCIELSKIKGSLKLAFIFCSLTALKRDVKVLCANGFRVEKVTGFDMFPYTSHVETVVLLSKAHTPKA